jgi:hypothetical protein
MRQDLTTGKRGVLALPRSAAARAIGISTRSLDRLIRAGAISTVLIFRRRLIPVQELDRFLAEGGYGAPTTSGNPAPIPAETRTLQKRNCGFRNPLQDLSGK